MCAFQYESFHFYYMVSQHFNQVFLLEIALSALFPRFFWMDLAGFLLIYPYVCQKYWAAILPPSALAYCSFFRFLRRRIMITTQTIPPAAARRISTGAAPAKTTASSWKNTPMPCHVL